jgi:hypothetical protein
VPTLTTVPSGQAIVAGGGGGGGCGQGTLASMTVPSGQVCIGGGGGVVAQADTPAASTKRTSFLMSLSPFTINYGSITTPAAKGFQQAYQYRS